MYRQHYDLDGEGRQLGSISNTKVMLVEQWLGHSILIGCPSEIFNNAFQVVCTHSQADRRVQHFYANQSLLKVTTAINLIALLQEMDGWVIFILG